MLNRILVLLGRAELICGFFYGWRPVKIRIVNAVLSVLWVFVFVLFAGSWLLFGGFVIPQKSTAETISTVFLCYGSTIVTLVCWIASLYYQINRKEMVAFTLHLIPIAYFYIILVGFAVFYEVLKFF